MVKGFIVMYALELKTLRAEIDQQSDLHFIRFEVIHGLGKVNVFLKAVTKCGVDFHGCSNNAAGQIFVFHVDFRLSIMVIPLSF